MQVGCNKKNLLLRCKESYVASEENTFEKQHKIPTIQSTQQRV